MPNNEKPSLLTGPFPPVPRLLLEALEARFPLRSPSLTEADRKIWFNAGARSVVEFLRYQYDEQQNPNQEN